MKTEKEVLTLIIRYIRKHIKFIALALSAGAMCAVCSVAGSELLKRFVDGLEAGKLTDIGRIILMCAGILAAGAGSAWITRYASGSVATKMLREIKDDAVAHIACMTEEFLSKNRSGDILSRLSDDVNRVSSFVQDDLIFIIRNPFLLVFYFVYLLYLNPALFLISIVPTLICLPFGASLTTKFKAGSWAYMRYSAEVISDSADMIGGMEIVKGYSLQETLLADYRSSVWKMTDMAVYNDQNQYKGRVFFILSGTLSSIFCLAAGGWFCLQGRMTIGALVAFFSLLPQMIEVVTVKWRWRQQKECLNC